MAVRKTKEQVQAQLDAAGKGFVLLGEYKSALTKTTFQCANQHTWEAKPNTILNGAGCPHCSNRAPLTAEVVNERLAPRGITLIGPYVNTTTSALFACSNGHEWTAKPGLVMFTTGCPHCSDHIPLTMSVINERIAHRGLRLIGEYVKTHEKALFQCDNGHEWRVRPNAVMRGDGCPHCANCAPLTAEIVNERIAHRGISLIGEYVRSSQKTTFQCDQGHTWEAKPNDLLTGYGCPHCANYGVWSTERCYLYVMDVDGMTKIGISAFPAQRLAQLRRKTPHQVTLAALYHIGNGRDAYAFEQDVHKHFSHVNAGLKGFDGATELFRIAPAAACVRIESMGATPVIVRSLS